MNEFNLDKIKLVFQNNLKNRGSTQQYLWHLKNYFNYLEAEGTTPKEIEDPQRSIQEFLNTKSEWKESYVNVSFYAIKMYYEKLLFKIINPKLFTNMGKVSEHEPRILSRNEVKRVWQEAHKLNSVEEIMIHVGWEAALRSKELVLLKGENFLQDGSLQVRVLKAKRAIKRVQLSPDTLERVKALITKKGRYVFRHPIKKGYSKIRRYTSLHWSKWFHWWTSNFLGKKGIRWHDFARHTRLTHYAEDTKNFMAVLQLSGHQSPGVCRKYFERAKIEMKEFEVVKEPTWKW